MDPQYNHQKYESDIYKLWESSGSFTPSVPKNPASNLQRPFSIIMPPPNASDPLHIGHAREVATQDTLVRYHRMKGDPTLWLPGSDHAGIETQFVFERKLREKGQSRFDFDRDTLYEMIQDDVMKNIGTMHSQLKALGASCDWTRHKFTLDPDIIKIVYKTFKDLYDDGLIYRGKRIVNYCPRCGTNFSELEVDHVERDDTLYYLNYGTVVIATTRPETIFADVAVAVNPKDPNKAKLIGQKAKIPLIDRGISIIGDSLVEMDFGTGALKITPGHDPVDFEIGKRHKLPAMSVLDESGRMTGVPEKYSGMKVLEAREAVVADLKAAGILVKTETIHHTVGICYRDKGVIEPMISEQWFLKVKPLTELALTAIKKGEVKFVAKKYEKIARHWYKNLKDWNLSRQIVWGIRIPAYRCEKCLEWTITDGTTPSRCPRCHAPATSLKQDVDTFDTWFSSGQWPFATLKTTKPGDFDYFYPTSVIDPAYEILPFWIIRMIMLGLYETKKVPFRDVLLHGLVRDKQGLKISKSKGNVINPIEMAEKYGADALRVALIWGSRIESDNSLSEENIKGQRNFANKLWNIARFVFMTQSDQRSPISKKSRAKDQNDKHILTLLSKTIKKTTRLLDKYRLNEAAEEMYNFIWKDFANEYLEKVKSRREEAQPVLEYVLQQSLKLAHPFMPFVTEAIWQEHKERFDSPLLVSAPWPR